MEPIGSPTPKTHAVVTGVRARRIPRVRVVVEIAEAEGAVAVRIIAARIVVVVADRWRDVNVRSAPSPRAFDAPILARRLRWRGPFVARYGASDGGRCAPGR